MASHEIAHMADVGREAKLYTEEGSNVLRTHVRGRDTSPSRPAANGRKKVA